MFLKVIQYTFYAQSTPLSLVGQFYVTTHSNIETYSEAYFVNLHVGPHIKWTYDGTLHYSLSLLSTFTNLGQVYTIGGCLIF